jgi:hypothetical protein
VPILGSYLPRFLQAIRALWKEGWAVEAQVAEQIDLLAKQSGPVACEELSLCYWGKGFEIDFFLIGQKPKPRAY